MHKVLHSLITKSNQGTSKPHGTVLYQPRGPGIEWERHNLILLPSWLVILPCRFYTGGSDGKESAYNAGDLLGFNPWVRKIPWRKEWQPIPVFLPGKFQGQRNLVGYSPWVCKESDMTEWLTLCFIDFTTLLKNLTQLHIQSLRFWHQVNLASHSDPTTLTAPSHSDPITLGTQGKVN